MEVEFTLASPDAGRSAYAAVSGMVEAVVSSAFLMDIFSGEIAVTKNLRE